MPPGQSNFPELADELEGTVKGGATIAAPRNFRPPSGFMNEDGPEEDRFAGKSTDEIITLLSTRSDHWYNLALAFPRLYAEGFDRATLEEIVNVDPARQNVWSTAAAVFHSLKGSNRLSSELLSYFNNEDHGPDCLMELRFLDAERRLRGARYIAEQRLASPESKVLGRAIKEHARRTDVNEGFSSAAGDCLAFKYWRDAQENRDPEEVTRCIARGLGVAVTETARQKLLDVQEDSQIEAQPVDGPAAVLEIARLQKDDIGFRTIPLAGAYGAVTPQDVQELPTLGGNGPFQVVALPPGGGQAIVLPRWNVLALAKKPAVLTVNDASKIPEIVAAHPTARGRKEPDLTKIRGQALLVVDTGSTVVEDKHYYLVDDNGMAMLRPGSEASHALARVLVVCLPPRQQGAVPEALDV